MKRLLPMSKPLAAAVSAGLGVVARLFLVWRQEMTADPWWRNLLRAAIEFLAMFVFFLFVLWLPDWARRKVEAAKKEGRLKG